MPVLTLVAAIPLLRRLAPLKVVTTAVAVVTLLWGLGAHMVRPDMFDGGTTATYVVMGTMLSFAAVVLISQYQWLVLRPLRPLIRRPSEAGLSARLAVAYPTARRVPDRRDTRDVLHRRARDRAARADLGGHQRRRGHGGDGRHRGLDHARGLQPGDAAARTTRGR